MSRCREARHRAERCLGAQRGGAAPSSIAAAVAVLRVRRRRIRTESQIMQGCPVR
jgi:hypothetical protein